MWVYSNAQCPYLKLKGMIWGGHDNFLEFISYVFGNRVKLERAQFTKQPLPAAVRATVVDPRFQTQKAFSFCTVFRMQQSICLSVHTQGMAKFIPPGNHSCYVARQNLCSNLRQVINRHCIKRNKEKGNHSIDQSGPVIKLVKMRPTDVEQSSTGRSTKYCLYVHTNWLTII